MAYINVRYGQTQTKRNLDAQRGHVDVHRVSGPSGSVWALRLALGSRYHWRVTLRPLREDADDGSHDSACDPGEQLEHDVRALKISCRRSIDATDAPGVLENSWACARDRGGGRGETLARWPAVALAPLGEWRLRTKARYDSLLGGLYAMLLQPDDDAGRAEAGPCGEPGRIGSPPAPSPRWLPPHRSEPLPGWNATPRPGVPGTLHGAAPCDVDARRSDSNPAERGTPSGSARRSGASCSAALTSLWEA